MGARGVLLGAKTNGVLDLSGMDHGQPVHPIASVPLSPARALRSSMVSKLVAAESGCLAIAAPGAIFALIRDGNIALRDEYLSATDIVLPLEPRLFLVNIPYARFLPIVRC